MGDWAGDIPSLCLVSQETPHLWCVKTKASSPGEERPTWAEGVCVGGRQVEDSEVKVVVLWTC